jgi:hypothetical protein
VHPGMIDLYSLKPGQRIIILIHPERLYKMSQPKPKENKTVAKTEQVKK